MTIICDICRFSPRLASFSRSLAPTAPEPENLIDPAVSVWLLTVSLPSWTSGTPECPSSKTSTNSGLTCWKKLKTVLMCSWIKHRVLLALYSDTDFFKRNFLGWKYVKWFILVKPTLFSYNNIYLQYCDSQWMLMSIHGFKEIEPNLEMLLHLNFIDFTNIQVYGTVIDMALWLNSLNLKKCYQPTHQPTDRTNSRDAVASKNLSAQPIMTLEFKTQWKIFWVNHLKHSWVRPRY